MQTALGTFCGTRAMRGCAAPRSLLPSSGQLLMISCSSSDPMQRGFERIEQLAAQKREAMAAASASEDGEAMPAADQPAIADSSQQSAAVHGLQQRPATASAPPEQPEARNPSLSFASGGLQQHAPMPPSSIGPAAAAAAAGDRQAHTGSMKISPPQQLQGGSAAPGQAGESQHLQLGTGRPQAAQPQTHLEPSAARVQP